MFSRSAELYDAFYAWKDYPAEAEKLDALIRRTVRGARTLLDVACGTGKHLELLRDRYEVEGVELDPAMLAIARRRLPGVPLHEGDMTAFDLGREFDVVTCLFSSIGYARTRKRLVQAAASLARHVRPGGALVVEPWILPEAWQEHGVYALFIDEPELKAARVDRSTRDGDVTAIDFHYVVGTPARVDTFEERHEVGLFAHADYVAALEASGLDVRHDPEGLTGRGLYIGVRPV